VLCFALLTTTARAKASAQRVAADFGDEPAAARRSATPVGP
jgi:hypothetical protein